MKILTSLKICCIAVLLPTCVSKTVSKSDLRNENLNGKISSIAEYSYQAINNLGKFEKGQRLREHDFEYDKITSYNEQGYKISEKRYNSDGVLKEEYHYTYNDDGLLQNVINISSDGQKTGTDIYIYQDKVLMEKQMISEIFPSLNRTIKYKYDSNGRIIEEFGGFVPYISQKKYDDKGNIVELKSYRKDMVLLWEHHYKYNNKGILIEERAASIGDDYIEMVYKYEYDNRLNITKKQIFNINADLEKSLQFSYQYDKHGNWIGKTLIIDGEPKFIIERQISYF